MHHTTSTLERGPAGEGRLELLERAHFLDLLDGALGDAAAGRGRLLLFGGEAGVGKTALLRAFCDQRATGRVLWGACERLFAPRALGPFLDIGEALGLDRAPATPHAFLGALIGELRREPPAVLVVEDLHWADEGTLDVLKLLARRIHALPVLALASFRDDQLAPADQLQMVLGELARTGTAERNRLAPLSFAAVRSLAEPCGADPGRVFETTGGNPFFVTEVLAAVDVGLPDTVRDAVLARVATLAPAARRLLDAAAVVPGRIEVWLLEAVAGMDVVHLEACLASGMLRHDDGHVAFRHELARLAIEEAIAPDRRRQLHRAVLRALRTSSPGPVDPARLAHHADAAGDVHAVLRHAPAAAERAAALRSHHEAAQQYARALRHASLLPPERRARLLERRSYECYLTAQLPEAIEARRAALALHREAGDRIREGDGHRWLSRLAWFAADNATARAESRRAIEILEREPPGSELAMAYSNAAQLAMLAGDARCAGVCGGRAIALAERLGETEILVHALNNVGAAELVAGNRDGGIAKLERSLALALDAGLEEHVARAHTNLGTGGVRTRDYALAARHLAAGLAYCEAHDLGAWWLYMAGWDARRHLEQGRWDTAGARAAAVLRRPRVAAPSRITPLVVLGLLHARRGEPDPWPLLDEALALARRTGELQRPAPVAAARAEVRWLEGDTVAVAAETDAALALAREREDAWTLGELSAWRRRAGVREAVDLGAVARPFALELRGDRRAAADRWQALGCPYEAALLRGEPAGRGPRRSTRSNPAQLTARQLEILRLLYDRLSNAEIAARLVISRKTVDHHVSAILGKMGVHSRQDAAAEAVRLGIAGT